MSACLAPSAALGPELIAAARSWLGVRWRHLGRARTGVDCIGLVLLAARDCGVMLPDPAPYEREPQGPRLVHGILQHAARVRVPRDGDVLLFRMGLYGGHVGLASTHPQHGGPAVIHAFARHGGVVCEQPMIDEFRAALVGAFRLRG